MKLVIGYLYGDLMNIYGDTGNIICLKKRAEWRGVKVTVKQISLGDKLSGGEADLYFFGGGQDQAQIEVAKDLEGSSKGQVLREEIEQGIPLLSVCGGYQLLGEYYQPNKGEDHKEGCIYKHAIGCYMHGSLLPKNPVLADWLLEKALETKYKEPIELESLADKLESQAHNFAVNK